MKNWTQTFCGVILAILSVTGAQMLFMSRATAQTSSPAPKEALPLFEKDKAWPKPLPNGWYLGEVTGISIVPNGHIWIIHRPDEGKQEDAVKQAASEAAAKAHPGNPVPRVIEFDSEGNYIQGWGGPSDAYAWPQQEHGITVDTDNHVWISGHTDHSTPPSPDLIDTQILKFTLDGKFLMMIGHPHSWGGSNDKQSLGNPTNMRLDSQTNELFVSDGEGNHRVVVFDAASGAYKRHWGAYGGVPDDKLGEAVYDPTAPPSKQFGRRSVHCLILGSDGLVYACDRANDRVQVFRKDGTFVREGFVSKRTLGLGSVWSMGFSPDGKFLYVGDGTDRKVWILLRDTLQVVGSFGEKGSPIGEAGDPAAMDVDAKGNVYVAYPLGRFILKGYGVADSHQ